MLFFNKPKPVLADLIPDGYTDIHSHLLPGIDDGANDIEDTASLIKTLQDYGFANFITTPHILTGVWNNTADGIRQKETETIKLLPQHEVSVPFKSAAEYLMDDTFLNLLKTEELLTLKDRYVLVEMSYLNPPMQLYDIIYELQLRDYKPVLAHPERYNFYAGKMEDFQKLKRAGCFFQLNLLSVTGYYGKGPLETSKRLLEAGMIDFTGSDVHHERHTDAFKSKVLLKETAALIKALDKNLLFAD
ncbi:MAG: tyrosine-protein phosphatase [Flavobacterium sp.]